MEEQHGGSGEALSPGGRRRRRAVLAAAVIAIAGALGGAPAPALANCASPANAIVAENCRTDGVPTNDDWDVSGAGSASIQGFATDISVNPGSTIHFKIDTTA